LNFANILGSVAKERSSVEEMRSERSDSESRDDDYVSPRKMKNSHSFSNIPFGKKKKSRRIGEENDIDGDDDSSDFDSLRSRSR
jgi:hypothetical protein